MNPAATADRPAATDGRQTRHRARRVQTRRAILDAAVAICVEEGPAALTTTRLSRAAGITQPGFYTHFDNVEDCLRTMAGEVGAAVREHDRAVRLEADLASDPREAIRDIHRRTIDVLLVDRTWLTLFLRYRRDPTHALGRAMMDNEREGRERLIVDLHVQARTLGLGPGARAHIEAYADIAQAQTAGAVGAILDGRVTERELFVDLLTDMTWGMLAGLVARAKENRKSDA